LAEAAAACAAARGKDAGTNGRTVNCG
jgi:hypothetical protein